VSTVIDTTPDGIVVGNRSTTLGGAIVIGADSSMTLPGRGTGSVLVGQSCESLGSYSVNVGYNTQAGENSVALGRNASTSSVGSVAIGYNSLSTGTQAISLGSGSEAQAQQCIAIGKNSKANQNDAISIGGDSQAIANQSLSIGFESRANFNNAVSIGYGVQATVANQFLVGNVNNNVIFGQCFYPFEINPTTFAGTTANLGSTLYGINLLQPAAGQTIVLPAITTGMIGVTITFRKLSGIGSNTDITCFTGNQYYPYNSGTLTAAGVPTLFIGGSESVGRACCIGATTWAVI
jgi:hypothetical protein